MRRQSVHNTKLQGTFISKIDPQGSSSTISLRTFLGSIRNLINMSLFPVLPSMLYRSHDLHGSISPTIPFVSLGFTKSAGYYILPRRDSSYSAVFSFAVSQVDNTFEVQSVVQSNNLLRTAVTVSSQLYRQ